MISFKEYIVEHCKTGALFNPFNKLETDVFLALYDKLYPGEENIRPGLKIMRIMRHTTAGQILGDVMCKKISNERVVNYSQQDVDIWAEELAQRIKNEKF